MGGFNNPLSQLDKTVRQKINRKTRELTDIMSQTDLKDISRTFHSNINNIPSSQHSWNLLKIDHTK